MNKFLKMNGELIVKSNDSNRTKKHDLQFPLSKTAADIMQSYDQDKTTSFLNEENAQKSVENVSYSSLNGSNTDDRGESLNASLIKKLRERDQTDIIKEANRIMKERSKNLGKTLLSKPMSKHGYIQDCKEICMKNYLVDLLKDERTDLNDKELLITRSIKSSENKLNIDYKSFLVFMEREKQGVKTRDQEYLKYKNENDIIQLKEKKRIKKKKQIFENLEKIVRNIYTCKTYAIFVHNVVGIPFPFPHEVRNEFIYSDLKEKDKELELKVNKILKDFDGKDIRNYTPAVLEDTTVLSSKFAELEETVLKMIEKKHQTDKELKSLNEKQKEEFTEMKKREISLLEEKNKLVKEVEKVKKDMSVLSYKNAEVDNQEHLRHLNSLYRVAINSCADYDVNKTNLQLMKKRKENDTHVITELMENLKEKEDLVFNLITELDFMILEDEGLVRDLIQKRKEKNKDTKQLVNKMSQDENNAIKRKKAVERSNRIVLKGRRTMEHHMINKGTKKIERKESSIKNDDVYWLIHFDNEHQ